MTVMLANPRGFCAGVDRAIDIVNRALEVFGRPIYVRHEVVHNKTVVDTLAAKGAVFVDELDAVPEGAPVVFSAHGVARAVVAEAERRQMIAVDATFARSRRSFKKNTPIRSAAMMLVSRSAVTSAMGAWVNAQITKP